VSFAGAFPGNNFRTNLVLADVSGRGTEAGLSAAGVSGITGNGGVSFNAVANGEQQINGIGAWLGLGSAESGALLITPSRGETIAAVFAIDNKTNDPTYFPPDLPAPVALPQRSLSLQPVEAAPHRHAAVHAVGSERFADDDQPDAACE
jgi:hypothetical protein